MTDQSARVPFSPPRWLVPWITKVQVGLYEWSNGRLGSMAAGMRHLLLRTVGRRSGRSSTVCLPYWCDASGHRIVVASYAGGPRNPAWYHNLADRGANPTVVVQDRDRTFRARADVLKDDERKAVWQQLVADRPFYSRYQEMTSREIPLVRLVETSAAV
jgi:deazaflavin-dependent oxidoreductase (nitroreductase family)